jgi:hypothetical protein
MFFPKYNPYIPYIRKYLILICLCITFHHMLLQIPLIIIHHSINLMEKSIYQIYVIEILILLHKPNLHDDLMLTYMLHCRDQNKIII